MTDSIKGPVNNLIWCMDACYTVKNKIEPVKNFFTGSSFFEATNLSNPTLSDKNIKQPFENKEQEEKFPYFKTSCKVAVLACAILYVGTLAKLAVSLSYCLYFIFKKILEKTNNRQDEKVILKNDFKNIATDLKATVEGTAESSIVSKITEKVKNFFADKVKVEPKIEPSDLKSSAVKEKGDRWIKEYIQTEIADESKVLENTTNTPTDESEQTLKTFNEFKNEESENTESNLTVTAKKYIKEYPKFSSTNPPPTKAMLRIKRMVNQVVPEKQLANQLVPQKQRVKARL